jgi:hypothetical protein
MVFEVFCEIRHSVIGILGDINSSSPGSTRGVSRMDGTTGQEPAMNRKGVDSLPVIHRTARAANEEFPVTASDGGGLARTQPGWDPYEVWRDRVRESVEAGAERERDPPG